ncbi:MULTISPECIES: hypothetical protein [Halobacterium]|uniref:Uncharacterized protein n=4 Tax=Halobacterium salinarum TaxID=2242 RepID=Q9HMC8_HALSA|nr:MULTISPECIES: hypothetical protein [Halobacterium]AAG20643.1 hypothetical protein VNG_2603H [Halobacterium salinarum NRC-1]MBB6089422.1 hypothetical protein [Halobacterium salinarum]MCF2164593.1 hypothetical protein [Halobacterium salinarum]MCF2166961.1 hypothetical protein [Halobacterium salinarum]MCF2206217.1 hypothetical protein [Halobacterium salinarum]
MEQVWADDSISAAFNDAFTAWVDRGGGEVIEATDTRLRAEFQSTDEQMLTDIGFYVADGRHMVCFETVREELELKMLTRYSVSGGKLMVQSDKGSRTFSFNVEDGKWRVEKYPP